MHQSTTTQRGEIRDKPCIDTPAQSITHTSCSTRLHELADLVATRRHRRERAQENKQRRLRESLQLSLLQDSVCGLKEKLRYPARLTSHRDAPLLLSAAESYDSDTQVFTLFYYLVL